MFWSRCYIRCIRFLSLCYIPCTKFLSRYCILHTRFWSRCYIPCIGFLSRCLATCTMFLSQRYIVCTRFLSRYCIPCIGRVLITMVHLVYQVFVTTLYPTYQVFVMIYTVHAYTFNHLSSTRKKYNIKTTYLGAFASSCPYLGMLFQNALQQVLGSSKHQKTTIKFGYIIQ